jgi:hypothetical protein
VSIQKICGCLDAHFQKQFSGLFKLQHLHYPRRLVINRQRARLNRNISYFICI